MFQRIDVQKVATEAKFSEVIIFHGNELYEGHTSNIMNKEISESCDCVTYPNKHQIEKVSEEVFGLSERAASARDIGHKEQSREGSGISES